MKNILLTALVTVLLGGMLAGAVYEYQVTRPQPTISAAQAVKERNQAVELMHVHDAVNKAQSDAANARITELTTQKTAVCTQLKTVKLTNAACQ